MNSFFILLIYHHTGDLYLHHFHCNKICLDDTNIIHQSMDQIMILTMCQDFCSVVATGKGSSK